MSRHCQAASDLIGMIYDCVLDPDRWNRVLEACCQKIGFHYAALSLQSLPSGVPLLHAASGLSPDWLARVPDYSADFIERWGGRSRVEALPLSEPAVLSQVNPGWADAGSRYWREWAQPLGIHDVMALGMLREPAAIGSIILARHWRQGPIDPPTIDLARAILPHAQRALAISRKLEGDRLYLASFRAALDRQCTATLLLGENCQLLHANRTAEALLEIGAPLRLVRNRLRLSRADLDKRLGQVVADACAGLSAGEDFPLRDDEGGGYLLQVLPVSENSRAVELVPAVAMLLIRRLSAKLPAPRPAFAAIYGLTPAEAAVLAKIAEGNGVVGAARLLGSSAATVKTHLQRIFDKTGVRRQADLVALVSSTIHQGDG